MGQILSFGPSAIRARRRKPRSVFYDQGVSSNPAAKLLKEALVWLQPSGIEDTAGNVTAWRNSGTGGSSYDLTSITGTPVVGNINGVRAVSLIGGSTRAEWLEPATNVAMPSGSFTIFVACRPTTLGVFNRLAYSKGQSAFALQLPNTNIWTASNGGLAITRGTQTTTSPVVVCARYSQPESRLYVTGLGEVSNSTIGVKENVYITLGGYNASATTSWHGQIGEFALLNRLTTKDEEDKIIEYFEGLFGM